MHSSKLDTSREDRVLGGVRRILGNQEGMALAITVILLLSLAAMALTATLVGSTDLFVAGHQRNNSAALDVAEAGVAEALNRMSARPGEEINVNGVDVDISIQDPSSPPDPDWKARIFLTDVDGAPGSADGAYHTGTVQAAADRLEYADPNDPTEAVLIEHKKRDFNGDGVDEVVLYSPSRIPPENPTEGSPVEVVTVTGHQGIAKRTIKIEAIRFPIFPNISAALDANGTVDLRGNVTVCGHDHRIDTPPGTQLPACSPGWDTASGHLPAVMTPGYGIQTQGSTDLLGSPVVTDTDPANPFYSLAQALGLSQAELKDLLAAPDHTEPADTMDGISYLQGDYHISGLQGEGLLYVDGDLELSGNARFVGLVYVEGEFVNTGTTWILGAVLADGDAGVAVDFGAGTPVILYSSEALERALTRAMRYVTLAWKEVD